MIVRESLFDPQQTGDDDPRSMDVGRNFRGLIHLCTATRKGPVPDAVTRDLTAACRRIAAGLPEDPDADEISVRQVVRRMAKYLAEEPEGLFRDDMLTWLRDFPIATGNTSAESADWEIGWFQRIAPQCATAFGGHDAERVLPLLPLVALLQKVAAALFDGEPTEVRALVRGLDAEPSFGLNEIRVSFGIRADDLPGEFVRFTGPRTGELFGFLYTSQASPGRRCYWIGTIEGDTVRELPSATKFISRHGIFRTALNEFTRLVTAAEEQTTAPIHMTAETAQDVFAFTGASPADIDPDFCVPSHGEHRIRMPPEGFQRRVHEALGASVYRPPTEDDSLDAQLRELGVTTDDLLPPPKLPEVGDPRAVVFGAVPQILRSEGDRLVVMPPAVSHEAGQREAARANEARQRFLILVLLGAAGLSPKDFLDRVCRRPIHLTERTGYGELVQEWAATAGPLNILEAVVIASGLGLELAVLAEYLEGTRSLDATVAIYREAQARSATPTPHGV